jgi:twinkle protein
MRVIPDNIDFDAYLAKCPDADDVRRAADYEAEVLDLYHGDQAMQGAMMPWPKTHSLFRFRKGEVTLWNGINGHGKSMAQGFVNLSLMDQGEKVCIASFEMKPVRTLARMARQAAGCIPSPHYIRAFHAWADGSLWFYDRQGTVDAKRVLGVIAYCADELKITHFVIDSLMKCGINGDDYNRQKWFLDELTTMARRWGIHIHLVVHSRKGDDELSPPGKFDVAGSSDITNQPDNVLNVWRNKRKEREAQKPAGDQKAEIMDQPDVLITCDKNRNGDWEGKIKLWFDAGSYQYMESPHDRLMDFFHFDKREWQE